MTSSTPVLRKYFDFVLFDNFNSFSNSKGLKRPAQNTPSWMGFQGIPYFFGTPCTFKIPPASTGLRNFLIFKDTK